jgi:heme-degrading monooxygenase HmoA
MRRASATLRAMTDVLAATPEPPYWAVIFTSVRNATEEDGYDVLADRMAELAAQQPGYLGLESVRAAGGLGITVSYWASEEALRKWKANAEHLVAQRKGREGFYTQWFTRVCRVERAYSFEL